MHFTFKNMKIHDLELMTLNIFPQEDVLLSHALNISIRFVLYNISFSFTVSGYFVFLNML